MAQEAHNEPTMEEILASIRKIISEDDAPKPARPSQSRVELSPDEIDVVDDTFAAEVDTTRAGAPSFEDLVADISGRETAPAIEQAVEDAAGNHDLASDDDDDGVFETEPFESEEFQAASFEDETEPSDDDYEVSGYAESLPPPPYTAEMPETAGDPGRVNGGDTFTEALPTEHEERDHPAPSTRQPDPIVTGRVADRKEEVQAMAEPARSTSLTEDSTADAAAGALSRLVSKLDMGSEHTLEGIVRELLRPMLKEWLDENLRDIVEAKVEAEVERIARLAR